MEWIYIGLAAAVGAALLAIAARATPWRRSPDFAAVPMTPLQKRAWLSLTAGIAVMVALVAVFAIGGLTEFDESRAVRLSVYALLGAGVAAHGFVLPRNLRGEPRSWADERDLRIFERAPAVQGAAVLIVLAAWTIGLTETYRANGSIPLVAPTLMLLSAFFVHLASVSFGILLGYRRDLADGQG